MSSSSRVRSTGRPPSPGRNRSELLEDGSFGSGVSVTELNTPDDDQGLTLRSDGLEALFNSTRPGQLTNDLWRSTRPDVSSPWSPPVRVVGTHVNTADNEQFPALSADGTMAIFTSNRPGGVGGDDLYVMTRRKAGTYDRGNGRAGCAAPADQPGRSN